MSFLSRRRAQRTLDRVLAEHYGKMQFGYDLDDRSLVTYHGDLGELEAALSPYSLAGVDDRRYDVLLEALVTGTSAINYNAFIEPGDVLDMTGTAQAIAKLMPQTGDRLYLLIDDGFTDWYEDVCYGPEQTPEAFAADVAKLREITEAGPKVIASTVVAPVIDLEAHNPCVFEHDGVRLHGFLIGGGDDYTTVEVVCEPMFGEEPVTLNLSWFTPDSFKDAPGVLVGTHDVEVARELLPEEQITLPVGTTTPQSMRVNGTRYVNDLTVLSAAPTVLALSR